MPTRKGPEEIEIDRYLPTVYVLDAGSRGEEELTLVSGPAVVSPLVAAAQRRNDEGDRSGGAVWIGLRDENANVEKLLDCGLDFILLQGLKCQGDTPHIFFPLALSPQSTQESTAP